MGYRSDVGFALDKAIYLKYEVLADELPKILKESTRLETNDIYYWFFTEWKWYVTFEEVREMEKFMTTLEDEADSNKEIIQTEYSEFGFGYIRLGEDHIDIEEKGEPWDFGLYIHKALDTPFGILDNLQNTQVN